MRVIDQFPRPVTVIENTWITLSDGCRLAARIWMPTDAERDPVPAILEYLPYRKRDGTAVRDALTHPYFAGHGYACVRVDMRGNGESEGLMFDEYLPQEQDDAIEVIDWITSQPWCSGRVGMIGISWGGFNGLQVAARHPQGLAAVISLCSTVDRYADDVHYKGGCMLAENLGWSSTMLAYSSRPPDPALVGERWLEMWLHRLRNQPLLAEPWISHQSRDDYWRHGSVCEDYQAIRVPVLAVGGWADGYKNAVPQLIENLKHTCCKGIVGPWVHKYPHFAVPGPRIGFLQECLRWWDRWLKDLPTGVENDPDYRVYSQEGGPPQPMYEFRPGRWISEPVWPSPNIRTQTLFLGATGLMEEPPPAVIVSGRSPEDTGESAGEYYAIWMAPELPGDQRVDDARSLTFDGPALDDALELLGAPRVRLCLSVDKPQAHVAVRLNAVNSDGSVERITYGVLNLSQRQDREHPQPMTPGERVTVEVVLDHCAHRLRPGQMLRVSVSTAYWPLLWPDPEPVVLSIHCGDSCLELPVRSDAGQPTPEFAEPEGAPPLARRQIRPDRHERRFSSALAEGVSEAEIVDDWGEHELLDHGLTCGTVARERYRIRPEDPASAELHTHWTQTLRRGDWSVRTETYASLRCDARAFFITGKLEAYHNDQKIHDKHWEKTIPRHCL